MSEIKKSNILKDDDDEESVDKIIAKLYLFLITDLYSTPSSSSEHSDLISSGNLPFPESPKSSSSISNSPRYPADGVVNCDSSHSLSEKIKFDESPRTTSSPRNFKKSCITNLHTSHLTSSEIVFTRNRSHSLQSSLDKRSKHSSFSSSSGDDDEDLVYLASITFPARAVFQPITVSVKLSRTISLFEFRKIIQTEVSNNLGYNYTLLKIIKANMKINYFKSGRSINVSTETDFSKLLKQNKVIKEISVKYIEPDQ